MYIVLRLSALAIIIVVLDQLLLEAGAETFRHLVGYLGIILALGIVVNTLYNAIINGNYAIFYEILK